ncbi:MAG: hypothetical protein K940chlam9_00885 [Chlamydiae bacterium]|nr:hypothetical protein [Chlamydiota bacterium]
MIFLLWPSFLKVFGHYLQRRIRFIIDELPIFQKLQALDSLITEGRKYGVCALLPKDLPFPRRNRRKPPHLSRPNPIPRKQPRLPGSTPITKLSLSKTRTLFFLEVFFLRE